MKSLMLLIAVGVLVFTACNPCAGVDGKCIVLSLDGTGTFDQLELSIDGQADSLRFIPAQPKTTQLPQTLAIGSPTWPTSVAVRAFLRGNLVGQLGFTLSESANRREGLDVSQAMNLCTGKQPSVCGGTCVPDASAVSSCADTPPPVPMPVMTGTSDTGSNDSQPTTPSGTAVAGGFPNARALQVPADGKVYWLSQLGTQGPGKLWRYDAASGATPSVLFELPSSVASLIRGVAVATDATNIYVAYGPVARAPLAGGQSTVVISGSKYEGGLQVLGGNLYMLGDGVHRASTAGGAVTDWFTNQDSPSSLALSSNRFFWTPRGVVKFGLLTATSTDTSYQEVRSPPLKCSKSVATATHAAWVEPGAIKLYEVATNTVFGFNVKTAGDVALSGTHVVWSAQLDGSYAGVFAAPIPAATSTTFNSTTLAVTSGVVADVATAGGKVFWLDGGGVNDFTLMMAALP